MLSLPHLPSPEPRAQLAVGTRWKHGWKHGPPHVIRLLQRVAACWALTLSTLWRDKPRAVLQGLLPFFCPSSPSQLTALFPLPQACLLESSHANCSFLARFSSLPTHASLCSSSSARARRRIGRPFRRVSALRPGEPCHLSHRPRLLLSPEPQTVPRAGALYISFLLNCFRRHLQDALERSAGSCRRRSGERLNSHTACPAIDCPKPLSQHLGPFSRRALGEMAHFLDGKLGKRLLTGTSTPASDVVQSCQQGRCIWVW